MIKLKYRIEPLTNTYHDWVVSLLNNQWGSSLIISKGNKHFADKLPGFIAFKEDKPIGLLTYNVIKDALEIVTLNSLVEKAGIGTSLLETVKNEAVSLGVKRIWCITTNDNLKSQDFYRKRGFMQVAVYKNAVTKARKLKPEIPLVGQNSTPIEDEIEFELNLK